MWIRIVAFLLCSLLPAGAATLTAASASVDDVEDQYDLATHGDTVLIPAGTATWTRGITVEKAITIMGSGTNTGGTLIRDGITDDTRLLDFKWVIGQPLSRLTNIKFNDNGRSTTFNGVIRAHSRGYWFNATNAWRMRIDHCFMDHLNDHAIMTFALQGVVDHNVILNTPTKRPTTAYGVGIGADNDYGDYSWTQGPGWGTEGFIFWEDNIIVSDTFYAWMDGFGGPRIVWRYNDGTKGWIETHGTESGGRYRGGRSMEVYRNIFRHSGGGATLIVNIRSGAALIHNNTDITGYTDPVISTTCDRLLYASSDWDPWGTANGENDFDVNDGGNPFFTGSASSGSGSTVTITGSGWTVNQWVGYSVVKTSGGNLGASEIESNTSDTLTYNAGFGSPALTFSAGNGVKINKVSRGLDGPGEGQTAHFNSVDPPTVPMGGVNQQLDPIYEYNNTASAWNIDVAPHESVTRLNEQYYKDDLPDGYVEYTYPHPLQSVGSGTRGPSIKGIKLR